MSAPTPTAWPGAPEPLPSGPQGQPDGMELREQRAALFRLALVVLGGLVAADLFGALQTVLVVLALVAVIVLHEFGHFLTAKLAGMKVTEFFVGFGPRLWAVQKGETTYGVKALPLGGYCRILGMTSAEKVPPADEPRAYRSRPTWRRLTVAFAGSFVHFVLALVLLVVLFVGPGDLENFVTNPAATTPIGAVDGFTTGKSPAELAGLRPGDVILAIDGHHFATWEELTSYVKDRPGEQVTLTIERDGHIFKKSTVLANAAKVILNGMSVPLYNKPTGFLGIGLGPVRFGFVGSLEHAGDAFGSTVVSSITGIGKVVGNVSGYAHMLESKKASDQSPRLVSVVGVVAFASRQTSWSELLWLLIILNIFLGVFNLLPLPPLDGGHVVIALYEKARSMLARRPYHADVNKMAPIVYAVLALALFYGVTAVFMDLRDLVG